MKTISFLLLLIVVLTSQFNTQNTVSSFDDILSKIKTIKMKTLSVACPQEQEVLKAVIAAYQRKIANSILVGDAKKMSSIALEHNLDLTPFEIIDISDPLKAAHEAVRLVHDGKADMYMKGLLETKDFLQSVLDKEVGLRTGKSLSLISIFEIKKIKQLLFLTDAGFVTYPTLEEKVLLINNAVHLAHVLGIAMPKVAPLAAIEVVNPKMPETVEARALMKWNREGVIKGCIVDGPLSMDLAIDPEASIHKGAENRLIKGDADILLFPNIHAGNLVAKMITRAAESKYANVLVGASAPVIISSRSDSFETKVRAIALCAVYAEGWKKLTE